MFSPSIRARVTHYRGEDPRNLENQVRTYEIAEKVATSVKVIVCYTAREMRRVEKILKELDLTGDEAVVVVDARTDNKPSASKV